MNMNMNMNEQRRADRVQLSYFLKVHERGSKALLGQILDITEAGFNLLSAEAVEIGEFKSILIELPETLAGKQRLSLRAESRWCKRDINPSYYSVGYKFVEPSSYDQLVIEALMAHYTFGRELQDALN